MKYLANLLLLLLLLACEKKQNDNDPFLKIGDLTMGEKISQNNFCKDIPPENNGDIVCRLTKPNLELGTQYRTDRLELQYNFRGKLYYVKAIQIRGVPDGGDSNPSFEKSETFYRDEYANLVEKYGLEKEAKKYNEIVSWEKNNSEKIAGMDIALFNETIKTSEGILNIKLIKTTAESGTYENTLGSRNDVDSPATILIAELY